MKRSVPVAELEEGDVVFFGNIRRTVEYCERSSIDPVYLIGFKEGDPPQIAKGLEDHVLIEV